MLSIKNTIDTLDEAERRVEASASAYSEVLGAIEDDVLELFPQLAREHQAKIRRLRLAAAEITAPEAWRDSAAEVRVRLLDYSRGAANLLEADFTAVREMLNLLSSATQAIESQTSSYAGRFRTAGRKLEDLAQIEDPDSLRRQLQRGVIELRAEIAEMEKDGGSALDQMRREMASLRERLHEAELLASTDSLTGLLNRRAMERWIAARIGEDRQFCVLMFDLNEFKSINDRFGHSAGDQALIAFARVLADNVRPGDGVCRWAGDEFLALLECSLPDAMPRARQIASKLDARHAIPHQGREIRVSLTAESGIAQHRPGESVSQLFERVDQLMYAAKAARRGEAAASR